MPIISSQIIEDSPQADGRRWLRYRYSFDVPVGNPLVRDFGPIMVPAAFDAAADMAARVPILEEQEALREDELAIKRTLRGENPEQIANNPTHSTSKRIAKKLIRWMIRERDPRIVILLEPLIVYLRANFTNAQLLSFLDLTAAQGTKLNNRIDAILDPITGISVKDQLQTVFDANQEEIE